MGLSKGIVCANPCTSVFYFILLFSLSSDSMLDSAHGYENTEVGSKLNDFNFVVAGDFGCGNEAKKTIGAMASMKPELVMALGDLAYRKNPICWFNMIKPLENNSKFKISFGEHDVTRSNLTYNQYLKHFNLTKPYYSFNYKNVHFLAMATPKSKLIPYDATSEQYQFVKNDLRLAHDNKSINWIIVYSFRPFYSSNTTHPAEEILRNDYHTLFDKYGVDVVLQAHNHNYQRTYPITFNETSPMTPIPSDKDLQNFYKNPKGPIFITAGTGGAPLYIFSSQAPFVVSQFAQNGFLNVDIKKSGKEYNLTGTFYKNNNLIKQDYFIISKDNNRINGN